MYYLSPSEFLIRFILVVTGIVTIMKSTKIEDLDISIRCCQLLKSNGITDIVELTKLKENDLIKFRGFGSFSLKEIKQIMLEHGLSFSTT